MSPAQQTAFACSTSVGLKPFHSQARTCSLTNNAIRPYDYRLARRSLPLPFADSPSTPARWSMVSEVNIAKKAAKVSNVKEALSDSMLLVCAPLDGLTVSQVGLLKQRMPEGTKVITVKNTLMRRAIENSEWSAAVGMTRFSSLWIFVKEDMKNSIGAYNDFMKELAREAPIRGGVFEGEMYDEQGVDKVSKLPTKKELITKIAIAIKAVPTKIGRSVKEVPAKLGRAVKLAFAEEGEGSEDGNGDSQ